MNDAVKVSVCIPVYNAERYIAQCARSLFEQTLQHGIEFIFVDDCTPDQSFKVLADVLAAYPHRKSQVKIIRQAQNGGVCRARKVAMRHAVGTYIIHCDPDDWVKPTLYETLLRQAELAQADMVYCDYVRYHSEDVQKVIVLEALVDREEMIRRFLYRTITATCLWNKLYRRAFLDRVDLELVPDTITYGEDLVFNLLLLPYCQTIVKVNEPLYIYRDTPNSITANLGKDIRIKRNIFQLQLAFDKIVQGDQYTAAMESSQRFALYTAISSGIVTATQWHRLWKRAKRGMWKDQRWNLIQRIIFYFACLNFTLTSFVFKLLTGRLKASKQS